MYHVITGVTIAEYVRRRRLTLAAQDILSGEKIIDAAYKYGYETPEAVQGLSRRIFSEWFPSTGYQHDCAPELEVYPVGDIYSADYRYEIWIPVKK